MAIKTTTVCVALCMVFGAIAVLPMAEAQLGGFFGSLLNLLRIQGTLFCTANGQIGANGTSVSTPVFSGALVQLQCGNGSLVVSSALTNASGVFSILLDPITLLISALLQNCRLVVPTPLSNCNATFPSNETLVSQIRMLGSTAVGLLNVTNFVPTGFRLAQNLNN